MARNLVFFLAILIFVMDKMDRATADPLQIIFTDQPSNIVEGSEVHLTCVVSGGNNPHTTWISPTGLLPVNSRITNGGQTLVITNYDMTDNGQYICVVSDGVQFANHVFTLNVQHSGTPPTTAHRTTHQFTTQTATTYPTMVHPSATHRTTTHAPKPPSIISTTVHPTHYHFGDNVQLTCKVENHPQQTGLGWNMMTYPQHTTNNIHLDYGTNSVTINIHHLTADNLGEYQCFVYNSFGRDVRPFTLHHPI